MDWKKIRKAYETQKKGAKARGIGWELTFAQWVIWWGDDLERRGVGTDRLQMQRIADTGPYRLDNIRKGVPSQNTKTYWDMRRKRETAAAAVQHQTSLDALVAEPSGEPKDEMTDDERFFAKLGYGNSNHMYRRYRSA